MISLNRLFEQFNYLFIIYLSSDTTIKSKRKIKFCTIKAAIERINPRPKKETKNNINKP